MNALTREFVDGLSAEKNEPAWMRAHRARCLEVFGRAPLPRFGPDLSELDFSDLAYYARPVDPVKRWEDLPDEIRRTFAALRLPEAEQKALAGLGPRSTPRSCTGPSSTRSAPKGSSSRAWTPRSASTRGSRGTS